MISSKWKTLYLQPVLCKVYNSSAVRSAFWTQNQQGQENVKRNHKGYLSKPSAKALNQPLCHYSVIVQTFISQLKTKVLQKVLSFNHFEMLYICIFMFQFLVKWFVQLNVPLSAAGEIFCHVYMYVKTLYWYLVSVVMLHSTWNPNISNLEVQVENALFPRTHTFCMRLYNAKKKMSRSRKTVTEGLGI